MTDSPAPYALYYWPTPNGWKVSILLEELEAPYTLHPVNITQGDQLAPSFLALSPNGRMPALVDPAPADGGPALSLFESGAILEYLAAKHGRFLPADPRGRSQTLAWVFWQMGGLGPMAGQAHHFRQYAPEEVPYAIRRYTDEVNRLYGVMNRRLAEVPYLAGADYTIADMAAWPWVVPHENQGQDLADFPHLKRWFETVGARAAVQRGKALGAALREANPITTDEARKILFGQRAG